MNILQELRNKRHPHVLGALDIFKYIGPGLLVTVGFIDPGNWASNFAAGSEYGYTLLWVVTLSTVMLIALQHNVAHLGIVTGLCLSEAAVKYTPRWVGRPIIVSAVLASISTSLAEILGGAIALQMLFGISIPVGALLVTIAVLILLELAEKHYFKGRELKIVRLKVDGILQDVTPYRQLFEEHHVHISDEFYRYDYTQGTTIVNFMVRCQDRTDFVRLFAQMHATGTVLSLTLTNEVNN